MGKITDDEIIKAKKLLKKLEEAYNAYYDKSKGMPYDLDTTIRETAICLEQSIDEINRQKAEIERLRKKNKILSANANTAFQDGLNENRDLFKKEVEHEIKSEAITKFAERLKKKKIKPEFPWDSFFVTEEAIDNLVKEMTEEDENG